MLLHWRRMTTLYRRDRSMFIHNALDCSTGVLLPPVSGDTQSLPKTASAPETVTWRGFDSFSA